ncbi:MAG: 23S rRNA (guanosine(2251)-2'-O)-methyltransferase RlmB [Oscillospiraceae bacterium]|nr:23S rRNA (guanosine(2251)-2'-O)-methyltransferase RlmB [Oscillospiraceae bacterium]
MNEVRLIYGRNPIIEAITSKQGLDTILVADGDIRGSLIKIIALAKENNITVKYTNAKKLDDISGGGVHQGVATYVSPVEYCELQDILNCAKKRNKPPFVVVCDKICDPHNLGAIIRTSEGAGADGVIIPKRGGTLITPTAEKAAAGAVSRQNIMKVTNIPSILDELKKNGFWVYGAHTDGANYAQMEFSGAIALVLGSEGKGLSRLVKEKCDFLVGIPMRGKLNSLNVSAAGAVLMFAITNNQMQV